MKIKVQSRTGEKVVDINRRKAIRERSLRAYW